MPPADLVRGYVKNADGSFHDVTDAKWDKFAEGGVVSTTADMIKFLQALLVGEKLLPPAQLAEMKKFLLISSSSGLNYNFGLGLVEIDIPGAGKHFGFNGGTLGHLTSTFLSQDTGNVASVGVTFADSGITIEQASLALLQLAKSNPAWKPITTFNAKSDVMKIQAADAASAKISSGDMFKATFDDASLKLPLKLASVTTSNIKFADGSVLVVGDNAIGTSRDNDDNTIDIRDDFKTAAGKNNHLLGLGGDDELSGGGGNDKILGGSGDDEIDGRSGNDRLYGGKGNDEIEGGNGNDRVSGGTGRDNLFGEDGNDTLIGGAGRDELFGGDDNDIFLFSKLTDSGLGKKQRDIIYDFDEDDDRISLSSIDANTKLAGNQDFTFIGKSDFSGKASELHFDRRDKFLPWNDKTIIEGDVNGDGKADFQIELFGLHKLMAQDFIL
jgi:D-alanyl-D-alanine carboxypeptidase